jgi:hypothetical protein
MRRKIWTASVYGWKNGKPFIEGLSATLIDDDFDISKPYNTPKRNTINNLTYPYGDVEQKNGFTTMIILN